MNSAVVILSLVSGICIAVGVQPSLTHEDRVRSFNVLLFGIICFYFTMLAVR